MSFSWAFFENNKWIPYHSTDQPTVEALYQGFLQDPTDAVVSLSMANSQVYTLDFANMTQTNQRWGTVRPLSRNRANVVTQPTNNALSSLPPPTRSQQSLSPQPQHQHHHHHHHHHHQQSQQKQQQQVNNHVAMAMAAFVAHIGQQMDDSTENSDDNEDYYDEFYFRSIDDQDNQLQPDSSNTIALTTWDLLRTLKRSYFKIAHSPHKNHSLLELGASIPLDHFTTSPDDAISKVSTQHQYTTLCKLANEDPATVQCPICRCELWDSDIDPTFPTDEIVQIDACSHLFHKSCLEQAFISAPSNAGRCPTCRAVFVITAGEQPESSCDIMYVAKPCDGFPNHGTIVMTFSMPNQHQDHRHPAPGKRLQGDERQHFMPATNETLELVLPLYLKAFLLRKLFIVSRSLTRGQDNVITYSSIHLKSTYGSDPNGHGYPDPTYPIPLINDLSSAGVTLSAVEQELFSKLP